MWGPHVESAKTLRDDIQHETETIRRCELELQGGTLSWAVGPSSDARRTELLARISEAQREIGRLEKKLEEREIREAIAREGARLRLARHELSGGTFTCDAEGYALADEYRVILVESPREIARLKQRLEELKK